MILFCFRKSGLFSINQLQNSYSVKAVFTAKAFTNLNQPS